MSRRRKGVHFLYVAVDIECPSGHRLGVVVKNIEIDGSPSARTYMTGGGVRLRDIDAPTEDSGKVCGVCEQCGADVQLRWDRVRALLDRNHDRGRHTDTLRA